MPLTPGTRLGQYEIVGALGEGGMGEVYRARDPRLDREVAIKVLGASLAQDPEALGRFEREALSIAKLSHPNILAIFEFGREPGTTQDRPGTAFVVTELVDGETLRTRLAQGPLSPRKAIAYALQIARGIGAAHAGGIVHRDLKPDNVMVTRDDQIKILDFGLAKPMALGGDDATRGVAGPVTGAGVVLGTFGYMAPEQVRGQAVDHRADMFAFGAVLYEMLSGRRAFHEGTAADTMTAILTKEPPDFDPAKVPIAPALDRIVRRCLEKAPELRFQSANDLAFALETLSSTSSSSASARLDAEVPATTATRARLPWAVATLAVIGLAATWLWRGPATVAEPRWDTFTRVTESGGTETYPALSPDGSTVAYAARVNGNWGIYAQRVGGRNATPLVDDPGRDETAPAYSPDGARIAFHEADQDGGIFVAGATGESVRRVTDIGFHPAWSPDGRQIAFTTQEIYEPSGRQGNGTLYVVDEGGGSLRQIVEGDAVQPSWSPSGDRLVFWSNTAGQRDIFTVAAGGGARVPLTNDSALDWSPVWSPDGRFVYFSSDRGGDMNLWRIGVDSATGQPQGAPETVTAGVQASASLPSISKDGTRMAFRSRVRSINPTAIPFDPVTLRAGTPVLLDTQNNIRVPSDVSRDGSQLAYYSIGERQEDAFVGPINGPLRRVTDDAQRDRAPVFTPTGRSLIFYSNRDGQWEIWAVDTDGGGLHKVLSPPTGANFPLVSPAGNALVYSTNTPAAVFQAPFDGMVAGNPRELSGTTTDRGYLQTTGWSPDGRKLAGPLLDRSSSGREIGAAIYDLVSGTLKQISTDRAVTVKWLADSRRVIYFADEGATLVVVDTATLARTVIDVRLPGPSVDEMFAISPDNRTIYYGATRSEADIWIVERR